MGQWFSAAPAAAIPPSDINKQPCPICATSCTNDPTEQNANRIVCQKCANGRSPESAAFCSDCLQPWRGTDSTCANPDCSIICTLRQCATKTVGRMSDVPELRACPQCGALTSHEDGYKHMRCLVCACEFCFVCLQTKDESGRWRCNEVCPVEKRQTSVARLPSITGMRESDKLHRAGDVLNSSSVTDLDKSSGNPETGTDQPNPVPKPAVTRKKSSVRDRSVRALRRPTNNSNGDTDVRPRTKSERYIHLQTDGNQLDVTSTATSAADKPTASCQLRALSDGCVTLSRKPCCLTLDDDDTVQRAEMRCGHVIGVEGMKTLCEMAIKQKKFEVTCPECSTVWKFATEVRHVLSVVMTDEELREATKQISLNFINCFQDSKSCPHCQTLCERDLNNYGKNENKNRAVCRVCTRNNGGETAFCWKCLEPWPAGLASCSTEECSKDERLRLLAECATKKIDLVDGCPVIRACPRCGLLINHKERCKHMTCTACLCEFCFVCMRPKKPDGYYHCGWADDPCPVAPRQTTLPSLRET